MKLFLKIVGVLLVLIVAAATVVYFVYLKPKPLPISAEDRAAISIMPLPSTLKLKGEKFILTGEVGISFQGPGDEVIVRAIENFRKRIGVSLTTSNDGIIINYNQAMLPVQALGVDESYKIKIDTKGIRLDANTGYGVVRGLESLLQLVKSENGESYWPTLEMTDAPRYAWRGLLIDAGRHFIPKEIILRNLEAMAATKLNVLHWHLSDYQGFRVESKKFPKLHELGSDGQFYTQDDIKEIVWFARDRGIRIVPEFDLPGHSSGFLVGYPELGSAPGPYKLETRFGIFAPVIDPTREEVYEFLDPFIAEMTTLFPDEYFHIGGDEVNYSHWENNAKIREFMKANNLADNHALQAYFNERMEKILKKYNKKMIGWDEILNPALSNTIIVQSWRSQKSLFQSVQTGRQAILSAGYYLDHKSAASRHYGVDPEVLAGAVTIRPDTLRWQQYDYTMSVMDSKMEGSITFYGQRDSLRGVINMIENYTGFENVQRQGDNLNFSFPSDYGQIKYQATFKGDSINGEMSLGLLSFPFKGIKRGGNDVAGTRPPKVELIKPLTDVEKKNILGGEAAMWTELSNANNIESRIWPRLAAIAEKLWSPAGLTKDARDMYRRMAATSMYLDNHGLQHQKSQDAMIEHLAEGKDVIPLRTLISTLHEVKLTDRIFDGTTKAPLNEVVDASAPESLDGVRFSFMVDDFLADPAHKINADAIGQQLITWRDNHSKFVEVAKGNERLEKVIDTSEELSNMSGAALEALNALTGGNILSVEEITHLKEVFSTVAESRAGVYIGVKPALLKMVDAAK